jgi:hypothetical protein
MKNCLIGNIIKDYLHTSQKNDGLIKVLLYVCCILSLICVSVYNLFVTVISYDGFCWFSELITRSSMRLKLPPSLH